MQASLCKLGDKIPLFPVITLNWTAAYDTKMEQTLRNMFY